ncbi:FadR/GntR family transcriptional regulator [Clostridium sp. AWRP]|uniref:FadR/GntR family transcriptional regulator n=1 Tax=Clostridium sp. AWRP TaxID=2212991 RepID=UPI000FDBDCA1|nr:FadR/GntR family transcriptional regulator [Clostridium sp. AWRP]AZV55682.1 GntR family transcriptional regulator [Clostridium sp. AWRP]
MSFNPVSSKKLYLQIYNQILSQIQLGMFKIGDKLPPERELCTQFNVSRAPVRQALSALELNGYIYSRQGEGVFVMNNQPTIGNNKSNMVLESVTPEEIVEARMNIEPIIAKFAAERATDQEIENIRKIENKFEEEANEGIYNPETDEKLHVEISKASHNDLFIKFTNDINNVMKEHKMWIFLRDRTVTRPEYRDINVSEHREIVKSIENCDGEEAMKKMTKHMNNLYDRYWKE